MLSAGCVLAFPGELLRVVALARYVRILECFGVKQSGYVFWLQVLLLLLAYWKCLFLSFHYLNKGLNLFGFYSVRCQMKIIQLSWMGDATIKKDNIHKTCFIQGILNKCQFSSVMYTLNTITFDPPFPLLAIFFLLYSIHKWKQKQFVHVIWNRSLQLIINDAHCISGNAKDKCIRKLIIPCYMSEMQQKGKSELDTH